MKTLLRPRTTTQADLDWWLALAPTLTWTFARTYADSAPHSYVVAGKTPNLTREDCVRAAAVIRTFGQPAKYYSMTNIYLNSADGSLKWWSMNKHVSETGLINQATTERVYGVQNAPSTSSTEHSIYDEIATDFDQLRSPADGDAKTGLLEILHDLRHVLGTNPTVLDVGCGTGAVLDLGITEPERYTGVDPSQAMLNELLVKHSREQFAAVIPSRIEDALAHLQGQSFDLVIAAFGSASYFSSDALRQLARMSTGATVLMAYSGDYVPGYYSVPSSGRPESGNLRDLAAVFGVSVRTIGRFDVLSVERGANQS